ncbi:MAG TPA: flagellar hook-basal body complex protein, partial [Bryobacteraceae bacterium]|nr:flagellar hook-basal body complex protein [Bryobacteraceae bacterium]
MDALSVAAAGGLRARGEALDMLANNIANAATAGFKRDGEFYGLFQEAESANSGDSTSVLPVIEKPWIDHAQGTLNETGSVTDLALSGSGYFALNTPTGTLYTRNGNFRMAASGTITTQDGHALRLVGGASLQVRPGAFEVSGDGTVRQ